MKAVVNNVGSNSTVCFPWLSYLGKRGMGELGK